MLSDLEKRIRNEIRQHIHGHKANEFTIGVAEELETIKSQLSAQGEVLHRWRSWNADQPPIAYKIRTFFKKEKMKTTKGIYGHYVYIY